MEATDRREFLAAAGGAVVGAPDLLRARADADGIDADVCVVGGGHGGIGTALAAARAGASVVLIERFERLGGTSTCAFVNAWEPGPGCSFAREIYEALTEIPNAVHCSVPYDKTLTRSGPDGRRRPPLNFEIEPFHRVISDLLGATGRCRVLLGTRFLEPETRGRRVRSVRALDRARDIPYRIAARVFVDCTGGALLCRAAGFETMLGVDARRRFGEPSAPPEPRRFLNGISLCYRVRPVEEPELQAAPEPPVRGWSRVACYRGVPGGPISINPLAMIPGWSLIEDGYEATYEACLPRVAAHWHWLQTTGSDRFRALPGYEMLQTAPLLGIRESYRTVTEYILTEHDLAAGLPRQDHPDIVAVADHPLDIHGGGHGLTAIRGAYGIPYRCLVPRNSENLLVACRGAGFSHVAASSCRLSRTIMALGHAAGYAAAMAATDGGRVQEIDREALVRYMGVSV